MTPRARIVVGIDPWGSSDAALDWAADEARASGRTLHVLHAPAWPDAGPVAPPEPWDAVVTTAVSTALERHPGLAVTGERTTGSAAGALVRASASADLVVIGAHHESTWASALWASLRLQVPMRAACPVVVVPPGWRPSAGAGRPVLVGVDGSPASAQALRFALERAATTGESVRAVHCVGAADADGPSLPSSDSTSERALVQRATRDAQQEWPGVGLELVSVAGSPADTLIRMSGAASLLVVGSRGRGGFVGLLLGSVSSRLVGCTDCPLVVVHGVPEHPEVPVDARRPRLVSSRPDGAPAAAGRPAAR